MINAEETTLQNARAASDEFIVQESVPERSVTDRKKPKPKKWVRSIGIVISVTATAAILGLLTFWLLKRMDSDIEKKTSATSTYKAAKLCQTKECEEAAAYFKKNLNLSANPCNDYFNFVCGGWTKDNEKHFYKYQWSVYSSVRSRVSTILKLLLTSPEDSESQAVNEAKQFYRTCIDMDIANEREGIQRVISDFGGFPLYTRAKYEKSVSWIQRLAMAVRHFSMLDQESGFSMGMIYNIIVEPGLQIRVVKPPNVLYMNTPVFYKSKEYKKFLHDKMCLFIERSCSPEESKSITFQIESLAEFQAKIAEYIFSNDQDQTVVSTIQELEQKLPDLHFDDFLKEVFIHSNSTLRPSTRLAITNMKYLQKVSELLKYTSPDVIDNAIGSTILLNLVFYPQSPPTLKAYRYVQVEGDIENSGRVTWCFEKVQYAFRFAVGRMFVDQYYDKDCQKALQEVLKNMKKAYIELIEGKSWLEPRHKKIAKKKMEVLDVKFGYPKWIKNNALLDNYYSLKILYSTEAVIESFKRVFTLAVADELTKLSHPYYKDPIWSTPPHDVNAFHIYLRNTVIFPLGQYFTDFYWPKTTKALQYSGAGFILAHEMSHGLDTKGVLCDPFGNYIDWMDGKSGENYRERTKCLKKQYSAVVEPMTKKNLQGEKSIDENIADNGAIRVAYMGYIKSGPVDERLPGLETLDHKKLFFVGAAINWCSYYSQKGMEYAMLDEHTPDPYRVSIPASNFYAFSDAFNCPKGSKMNQRDKCVVW